MEAAFQRPIAKICAALCIIISLPCSVWPVEQAALPNGTWGQLLSKFVSQGRVDYAGIKKNQDLLARCLADFEGIDRQTYGKWNRKDQTAFWINAYNLFTIKAIVDKYPPEGHNLLYPRVSIRQIGRVWQKTVYRTAGQVVSLDQIEHSILRGVFKEPRIHFALVCASLGCPPLASVPYEGQSLDSMLDEQVAGYLSDPEHGLRWEGENRTLYLSKIFLWFGKDFGYYYMSHKLFSDLPVDRRNTLNFIWDWIPEELKASLLDGEFRILYLDYDWSLNDLRSGDAARGGG